MRCSLLRKRLSQINYAGDKQALPNKLAAHLDRCQKCTEFARASSLLTNSIDLDKTNGDQFDLNILPLEQRMTLVRKEARLDSHSESPVKRLIDFIQNVGWGRGRLTLGLSTAVAMLVFLTIVPFGYDQVVGYNLSLAGVCPEVAADDETMCDLLLSLGIEQPAVDVVHCDSSCSLILFDLQSEAEIELAIYAMADLGAEAEVTSVEKIIDRRSRTLWQQAHERLFSN